MVKIKISMIVLRKKVMLIEHMNGCEGKPVHITRHEGREVE